MTAAYFETGSKILRGRGMAHGAEGMEDMKQVRKSFVVVAAIAAKPANDNRTLYQQLQASLALELARLAKAGAKEIMRVTGHKTLSEVQRYTDAVDKARLNAPSAVRS
jgi:hypothetical protein